LASDFDYSDEFVAPPFIFEPGRNQIMAWTGRVTAIWIAFEISPRSGKDILLIECNTACKLCKKEWARETRKG